jgi:hypothetical protein
MSVSKSVQTRKIEIEFILQNWDGDFPNDCPKLNGNYYFDDRRENGVGLVIGDDMISISDLDQAIVNFLTPIKDNFAEFKKFSPILRALIYNYVYTCSVTIKCISLIEQSGAELDINVYPTTHE